MNVRLKTFVVPAVLVVSLVIVQTRAALAAGMVIDHRCVDITRVPLRAILAAKTNLHIGYGHTSHGSQLADGMRGLVDFANGGGKGLALPQNVFAVSQDDQSPGSLHLHESDGLDGDVGYYPDWVNYTRSFLGDPDPVTGRGQANPSYNVIIWSWCGQVSSKYASGTLILEYLAPMAQLELDYPGVRFVYMTGHLDHWDDANNKAANAAIRAYCKTNGKILYDFADIESWDPDGTYYEYAGDDCSYYDASGTYLGNWAQNWQGAHTENVDWYNCGSAHSEPLNANQKAYATWWLWARLAGWPGPVPLAAVHSLLMQ